MGGAATTFPPRAGSQDRDGPAPLAMEAAVAWIALVLAGLFEIGWPVGLKMAQEPATRVAGICVAVIFMGVSGFLLWWAQKQIPIGTAYAIWTGIGAAG